MAGEVKVLLLGSLLSPFTTRVRIALELKGVYYQFLQEDPKNKSQLLLQSNPVHKKIPVLIHNGKAISESLIILEYIDERWGHAPALLPRHPYDRALSRFWASFVDDKLPPALLRRVLTAEGTEQQKAVEEASANFEIVEVALSTTFNGKPYFGGQEIGYLDIALGSRAAWINVTEEIAGVKLIDPENTPLLHAWIRRFSALLPRPRRTSIFCLWSAQEGFRRSMVTCEEWNRLDYHSNISCPLFFNHFN